MNQHLQGQAQGQGQNKVSYCDQYQLGMNNFGAQIQFSCGGPEGTQTISAIGMGLAHLKVMAVQMCKQVKEYERSVESKIFVHEGVIQETVGCSQAEWDKFWYGGDVAAGSLPEAKKEPEAEKGTGDTGGLPF
jgi:hypothetical protein